MTDDVAGVFAGLPLRTDAFPCGAVFRLSNKPTRNLTFNAEPEGVASFKKDLPYVVVQTRKPMKSFRLAKDQSLILAQRLLDLMSIQSVMDTAVLDVRGQEHTSCGGRPRSTARCCAGRPWRTNPRTSSRGSRSTTTILCGRISRQASTSHRQR